MKPLRQVWRTIVKKNEKHANGLYDALVCKHSVRVTRAQATYRKARACRECALVVAREREKHERAQRRVRGGARGKVANDTRGAKHVT